jgi:hypothetical protein
MPYRIATSSSADKAKRREAHQYNWMRTELGWKYDTEEAASAALDAARPKLLHPDIYEVQEFWPVSMETL